jgi:hypothetical protein
MSFAPSSPVTGLAQTGLTSPTYTLTADLAPDVNGKQYAVTALGGTQTGVTTHSAQSPFTATYWRPKVAKLLGALGLNGQYSSVPVNTHKVLTRKGVTVAANQPASVLVIRTEIDVPAGAETYDAANVRAALSCHFGLLSAQSAGIGDTVVSNII